MYLSASAALNNFVDRLAAISPLSRDDITALRGVNARVTRVSANSDIVLPGAQFEHAVLCKECRGCGWSLDVVLIGLKQFESGFHKFLSGVGD